MEAIQHLEQEQQQSSSQEVPAKFEELSSEDQESASLQFLDNLPEMNLEDIEKIDIDEIIQQENLEVKKGKLGRMLEIRKNMRLEPSFES